MKTQSKLLVTIKYNCYNPESRSREGYSLIFHIFKKRRSICWKLVGARGVGNGVAHKILDMFPEKVIIPQGKAADHITCAGTCKVLRRDFSDVLDHATGAHNTPDSIGTYSKETVIQNLRDLVA